MHKIHMSASRNNRNLKYNVKIKNIICYLKPVKHKQNLKYAKVKIKDDIDHSVIERILCLHIA